MNILRRFALWLVPGLVLATCASAQQVFPAAYVTAAASVDSASGETVAPVEIVTNPTQGDSATASSSGSSTGSWWPRPYFYGGLALDQGGYSSDAGTLGAGVNVEKLHFIGLAEGWFENAAKLDSGTGIEFGTRARGFYRTHQGWYFGGGAQWSALNTDQYSKQAWRPTFGGGKDIGRENFSMRAQVVYILPGTDHLNALQGPEISLWLPSPASRSHFYYRQTIGLYEFHQTSVPGNPGTSDRYTSSFMEFTAMYRF
jgi:hypothetical protein